MAEDDENGDGRFERIRQYLSGLSSILLNGPRTLKKINKRITANEREVYKVKEQIAEVSGSVKTILAFIPKLNIDSDSPGSSSP